MSGSTTELIRLYRRRARRYDFTANLYYLIGYREWAYRSKAVEALGLSAGDSVVEIACGTGLNFGLLEQRVGPEGRITGVDLNDAMLARAAARVAAEGWRNVRLVQSDAAAFDFPAGTDAVLTTLAISLVPEYDSVIKRGCRALRPGGRFAILDLKLAEWAPAWIQWLALLITAPFGVTRETVTRRCWESLESHLPNTEIQQLFGGFSYLAVGRAGDSLSEEDSP